MEILEITRQQVFQNIALLQKNLMVACVSTPIKIDYLPPETIEELTSVNEMLKDEEEFTRVVIIFSLLINN